MRALLLILAACSSGGSRPDAGALGEDLGRRLTEAECEKSVDHAIRLIEADPAGAELLPEMTEDRAARVERCVAVGTLRDFRCLMNAATLKELGRCRQP
jgi:hypothetical protein